MPEDHVHRVNRVGADGLLQVRGLGSGVASQHVVKHVPADQRHKLDGDLKGAVLAAVARQRHVQIDLRSRKRDETVEEDSSSEGEELPEQAGAGLPPQRRRGALSPCRGFSSHHTLGDSPQRWSP